MLFNSLGFAVFLPLVFILYWFVTNKSLKSQNLLLLLASYFFYSCWDWRFLFLLIFSTFLDYFTGLKIADSKNNNAKKFWFWLSISANLGFLGFFKYYNFFATSFSELISNFGLVANPWTLKIILPIGISFYTFHGLSYIIDIYNNKIKPEKNFINYSVFVSFFPLLVAGPIERATHLLPQIQKIRNFDYSQAISGLKQILWGLFKKVVIADQCSKIVDIVFKNSGDYSGSDHVVGAILFAFQIYADFSGYSDIALGTAKLFGIELLRNFAFPYFSRDIAEFWRRWHISLSSWFRDYLYIPLGGSKGGTLKKVRNTIIIFVVSGFWHGANWTFIAWGLLNAIYILPLIIFNTNRNNIGIVAEGRYFPTIKETVQIITTFSLTVFAWIFFRAENLKAAMNYLSVIFSKSLLKVPSLLPKMLIIFIVLFVIIEWIGRQQQFAIEVLFKNKPKLIRYSFFYILIFVILLLKGRSQQFIYFQF